MKTRVLLVDDHRIFLAGLRILLEQTGGYEVVGVAASAQEALVFAEALQPGLVLLDVNLPDGNGADVAARLAATLPGVKIVMLSADAAPDAVRSAVGAGAAGFLLKDSGPEELERALEVVLAGKYYYCPDANTLLLQHYRGDLLRGSSSPPALSEREVEVLQRMVRGQRTKEIAAELGISVKTADTYRRRTMDKLGAHSVAEMVRLALRQGLVAL